MKFDLKVKTGASLLLVPSVIRAAQVAVVLEVPVVVPRVAIFDGSIVLVKLHCTVTRKMRRFFVLARKGS